jgi:hypothetical protein
VIGGIALAVQTENSVGNAGTGLAAGFVGVAFGIFFILFGTWAAAWDLRNNGK